MSSVDDVYARGAFARFVIDSRETDYGLKLYKVHQPAGHYPHPPTHELWIGIQTFGNGRANLDLGRGTFNSTIQERDALVRLPNVESVYEFEHDHSFLLLSIDLELAGFPPEAISALMEQGAAISTRSMRVPLIAQVAEYLWEITDPVQKSEKALIEAAVIFIMSLLTSQLAKFGEATVLYKGGLSFQQVKKLDLYINDHLASDIDISSMATHVGLSPFYFTRAFKTTYGTSPYKHLTVQRLALAKSLIATTKLQMDEIAFRSGFGNRTNMFRSFKKFFGVSPTHFKSS